jgi:hypothetical protein
MILNKQANFHVEMVSKALKTSELLSLHYIKDLAQVYKYISGVIF